MATENINFAVTANQSSAGDFLPIDSDTLAGCTVTNGSAVAVEYSTGGAWTTIAAGASATVNTGAIATTSLRFRKKTGDSYPVYIGISVVHPGVVPAQLVTDGGVTRLSDGTAIVPGAAVVVANFSPVVRSSVGDATDTNFVTLATFSVPGGLLGPNGWLEIFLNASSSINTLTKYVSVYVGGTNIGAPALASNQVSLGWSNYVFNTASELSQKCANSGSSPFGPSATPDIDLSVDTRVNFNVAIKSKWSAQAAPAGADTITLNGYYIKAHYAP